MSIEGSTDYGNDIIRKWIDYHQVKARSEGWSPITGDGNNDMRGKSLRLEGAIVSSGSSATPLTSTTITLPIDNEATRFFQEEEHREVVAPRNPPASTYDRPSMHNFMMDEIGCIPSLSAYDEARKVRVYTNEKGMEDFEAAMKNAFKYGRNTDDISTDPMFDNSVNRVTTLKRSR